MELVEAFLGNETIKQRLTNALAKDQLSHCYLLCGPAGSGKHVLARYITAIMECTGAHKPCGRCPQCHKILSGTHPDVIVVDEPSKTSIPVKLVREACADLYVRPNEGRKKIYVFPRAQALNPQGQNALLKCIEEPPPYGAFLLLCEHPEQLLPTIRSRCVELALAPLPEELLTNELRRRFPKADGQTLRAAYLRSGGYLGQAEALLKENDALLPQSAAFVEAFCANDALALLKVFAPMEKLKREELRTVLQQCKSLLAAALAANALPVPRPEARQLAAGRTAAALLAAVEAMDCAMTLLDANVSPAHICGLLSVRLSKNT